MRFAVGQDVYFLKRILVPYDTGGLNTSASLIKYDELRGWALNPHVRKTVGDRAYVSGSCGPCCKILIPYGDTEPELRGTANWCSALAAGKPDTYYRRGERKRPVLIIQAGVHGDARPEIEERFPGFSDVDYGGGVTRFYLMATGIEGARYLAGHVGRVAFCVRK